MNNINNNNLTQEFPRTLSIPQIQDVVNIEYQMVPGVEDSTIGQIWENCVSAVQLCPFQGLSSINCQDVRKAFAKLLEMLNAQPLDKITVLNKAINFQVENLKDINFEKIWTKFAETDELPQTTWTQIDKNNAFAVREFYRDYQRKIRKVLSGFQECIFRTLILSCTIAEVKLYIEFLGLWNKVKVHYYNPLPTILQPSENSTSTCPNTLLQSIKTKLLEKSGIQIRSDWINGTSAQLTILMNGQLNWFVSSIAVDFGKCLQLLSPVIFIRLGCPLVRLLNMINVLKEETKELVETCPKKFDELVTGVGELNGFREQILLVLTILAFPNQ